jgi:hypothetical protein
MWFKSGTFSGLGTDAWLINYGVGIGSTQFPTGTRLAAGNVQFTQNDLAVVRNINASGIVTALTGNLTTGNIVTGIVTTLSGTTLNYTGIGTIATLNSTTGNLTTGNIVTGIVTTISGTTLNYTGIGTISTLRGTSLNYTGIGTIGTLSSTNATLTNINSSGITTVGFITATNLYVTGVGTFLSSGLKIRNPANTFGYTISAGAIGADYTLTLPVVTSNTGIAVTGLAQTFTAAQTFANTLTAQAAVSFNTSGSNINIGTLQTTPTLILGGPSQTGGITLGQSTVSQTVGIATGVSGVGTTKTINFGTGGDVGSFTNINIGSATTDANSNILISGVTTFRNNNNVNTDVTINTSGAYPDIDFQNAGTLSVNGGQFLIFDNTLTEFFNNDVSVRSKFSVINPDDESLVLLVTNEQGGTKNVGIGTSVPTEKLWVQGNGYFTGIVTATTFSGQVNADIGTITSLNGTNLNYSGIATATEFSTGSGTLGFTTNTINGPSEIIIDPSPVGVGTTSGIVRIRGDLYVDGTQFIVNSSTIELADLRVGIATTVGTSLLLDGGGIGIGSANIVKTILWNHTAQALTSSDDWNLASGKQYEIAGTPVLDSTTLGTGVVNSSLTSVGTLGQVNVSGLTSTNNLYVAGVGTFLSSGLKIRNPLNTFGYTITGDAIAADYTLTLPVVTSNTGIAVTGLNQSFTGTQTFSALTATGTVTISGALSVSSANITHTGTTQNFTAGSYTTGTVTIGGLLQTGTITVGRATTSQTLNLATGVSLASTTKTINLGTGGATDSFTQINIGPTAGVGTVVINSGTNLGIGTTNPTSKLWVNGDGRFTGVVTATSFSGTLSGYASSAGIATYATSSGIATYATNAGISTYATNAGIATYATDAGVSTSVIGGIASVTQLSVSGISTFTNGPVLIGSGTSTGTGNQRLQVNSGAYVSGNLGVGTTNPTEVLQVQGNISINGTTSYGSIVSTSTTTTQIGIHSELSTSIYRSVEYTIQATQGTNFHATKILTIHNGTTAYNSEYGTIYNNASVGTFDVDLSGGNIRLLATPASSSSTTYTINFVATKI